jgi:hypothetical protein
MSDRSMSMELNNEIVISFPTSDNKFVVGDLVTVEFYKTDEPFLPITGRIHEICEDYRILIDCSALYKSDIREVCLDRVSKMIKVNTNFGGALRKDMNK